MFGEDTIAEMATAAATLLEAETFSASSERDALGRVLTAVSPDGSEVHYHYDEGGALQRVTLHHRGSTTEQTPVGEITYDAKGRRESITHGPLASPTSTTKYTYDPTSQRLTRLRTVRVSDEEAIQSLHYHYDAVGNITDIRDTAQQTVYFQNSVVEAANSYTYDGLYRLIEATGREHASEGTSQRTHADLTATPQPMTSDPSAMRRYTQQYVYDEVGNILEMRHIPATGTGWTRYYEYDEHGNRLLATSAPGDAPEGPYSHEYPYDAHGNMTAMPHLSSMVWNHDDELVSAVAGTETVYFQYAGGNRARKYTEKSGSTTEERIYLGSFEIYRKRVSGSIDVERESLHVSDDTGRILLIETKTIDAGSPITTPTGIWRYQISNHLGSAATELTEDGEIISYEEYHPYGTTAYRAVDSSIDVSAKRYRYTGMERDEETGLSYHTTRYYASWLGRWTAADPIGLEGGLNQYGYCGAKPINHTDLAGASPLDAANREVDAARNAMQAARTPAEKEAATKAYIAAEESRNKTAAEVRVQARKAVVRAGRAIGGAIVESMSGAIDEVSHRSYQPPASLDDLATGMQQHRGGLDAASRTLERTGKYWTKLALLSGSMMTGGVASAAANLTRGGLLLEAGIGGGVFAGSTSMVDGNDPLTVAKDAAVGMATGVGIALIVGGFVSGIGLAIYAYRGRQLVQASLPVGSATAQEMGLGVATTTGPTGAAAVGPGYRAAVALDTNALIAAVERGQPILRGRIPIIPITVAKEFLVGNGSVSALRGFLSSNGGRIGLAGSEAAAAGLRQQASALGRVLHLADSRVAAGVMREGVPLLTNDKSFGNFLRAIGWPVERF